MVIDEKLRWYGFWLVDRLQGGKVRGYYEEIRDSYKNGTSIEKTQEKIRKLISHAVRTTESVSYTHLDVYKRQPWYVPV